MFPAFVIALVTVRQTRKVRSLKASTALISKFHGLTIASLAERTVFVRIHIFIQEKDGPIRHQEMGTSPMPTTEDPLLSAVAASLVDAVMSNDVLFRVLPILWEIDRIDGRRDIEQRDRRRIGWIVATSNRCRPRPPCVSGDKRRWIANIFGFPHHDRVGHSIGNIRRCDVRVMKEHAIVEEQSWKTSAGLLRGIRR